jgi:phenylalanyl-tRNA synthetase alpha chain
MLLDEVKVVREQVSEKIQTPQTPETLDAFRHEFLVKKGKIQSLFDRMKEAPKEEKPILGKELNLLRKFAQEKYDEAKATLESSSDDVPDIDLTIPGRREFKGSLHPVRQTIREMTEIFEKMGFTLAEGPEIEDGFHNFDALNFPPDHPARDLQDTFFVEDDREIVLRTHTSPVQVRLMQNQKPPIRSIMPGRVYRNEAIDSTHLAEFHQIEGLYIDKHVTFSELKATMMILATELYGKDLKYRFRPSFFPFTEPSAEMDIMIPGTDKWMEVAGCGMVHPNVLKAGGIDPEEYRGYAFGFGIERVTMLKTGIRDIRLFIENDVRVLQQF